MTQTKTSPKKIDLSNKKSRTGSPFGWAATLFLVTENKIMNLSIVCHHK